MTVYGGVPLIAPVTVTVCPARGSPLRVRVPTAAGVATTVVLAGESTLTLPSALLPVTVTRSLLPTSVGTIR